MMCVVLPLGLENRAVMVAAAMIFQLLMRDDRAVGVIVHVDELLAGNLKEEIRLQIHVIRRHAPRRIQEYQRLAENDVGLRCG